MFHQIVVHEGARPTRWALFLHGILGTGANWRTFAKRVLAADPSWGAVLVDLRMHGSSQPLDPPHTVEACAEDLYALQHSLAGPITAVIGHSFGGKVALAYGALRERLHDPLRAIVSVDSNPGLRDDARGSEQILAVIEALESLPATIDSRAQFTERLSARGLDGSLIAWLMMNLRPTAEGFALRLELPAIRALLRDYFARDAWDLIEHPGAAKVTLVIGGRSPSFGPADRARAEHAATLRPDELTVSVIEESGHWVHVDAPDALYAIVLRALAQA